MSKSTKKLLTINLEQLKTLSDSEKSEVVGASCSAVSDRLSLAVHQN